MKPARVSEADWARGRSIMARSIRGGVVSTNETQLLQRLLAADEARYSREHDEERAAATRELNPLAGRK